jgi:acyl-coenzyme A thioesterase PaaI-like protein
MNDAFQDQIPGITCFGCGPNNPNGLQIKSYWSGPNEAVCRFQPGARHNGPPGIVNGGIIATVIDCHAVCTAIADGYRRAERAIGEGAFIPYVTGALNIVFHAPTPMEHPFEVSAVVSEVTPKKTVLTCEVRSDGRITATASVVAVRLGSTPTAH